MSDLRPMVDEATCQVRKAEEDVLQGEANGGLESVSCLRTLSCCVLSRGSPCPSQAPEGSQLEKSPRDRRRKQGHTEHQDINI